MSDDLITKDELALLESCQSSQHWNVACDLIKKARNGQYPSDWWQTVKQSGMMDRILSRWGSDSRLTVSAIDKDGKITRQEKFEV